MNAGCIERQRVAARARVQENPLVCGCCLHTFHSKLNPFGCRGTIVSHFFFLSLSFVCGFSLSHLT